MGGFSFASTARIVARLLATIRPAANIAKEIRGIDFI